MNYLSRLLPGLLPTLLRTLLPTMLLALSGLTISLMPNTAHALKINGVVLPDTWTIGEHKLVLNGAGAREYGFLRINVYVAALYLDKPNRVADSILQASTPRVMHLKMLRDISREDSVKAWRFFLDANYKTACKAACKSGAKDEGNAAGNEIENFLNLITETVSGDTQTFIFSNEKLEIFRNAAKLGEIKSAAFATTVLASWIGEVPSTPALKQQLLGHAQ